jgi:hypothetical protein
MGFFSWRTQDTDKSIANKYSIRKTFRVEMLDNKGNVWTENDYDGYGVFGGKDFYELLAEMNGVDIDKDIENYSDKMRMAGIELAFSKGNGSGVGTEGIYYPNLIEMAKGWTYEMAGPDSCEEQGFFYDSDEEDYES